MLGLARAVNDANLDSDLSWSFGKELKSSRPTVLIDLANSFWLTPFSLL